MIADPAFLPFDGPLLDALSEAARQNPRLRQNRNLHDSPEAPVQRFFNAMEPASFVPPHRHLAEGKEETLLMVRGRLGVILFDASARITARLELSPAGRHCGFHLGLDVWHSVVALESGTIFFETKTGPYRPLEPEEKAPWTPAENSPEAALWVRQMHQLFLR